LIKKGQTEERICAKSPESKLIKWVDEQEQEEEEESESKEE